MKLPRLSGREVIKILGKFGYEIARQRGSHIIMVKFVENGKKPVVVPNHKEIDKGTLLEILRQAGISKEDLEKSL